MNKAPNFLFSANFYGDEYLQGMAKPEALDAVLKASKEEAAYTALKDVADNLLDPFQEAVILQSGEPYVHLSFTYYLGEFTVAVESDKLCSKTFDLGTVITQDILNYLSEGE